MNDEGAAEENATAEAEGGYWEENLRILAVLLGVWFVVSFGLGILLVEPLNEFRLGGFPLGFWFAQQGSIFVFIVLVLIYAVWIQRAEARYFVAKDRE